MITLLYLVSLFDVHSAKFDGRPRDGKGRLRELCMLTILSPQLGELFTWGKFTAGDIVQLCELKHLKVDKLCGNYHHACVISEVHYHFRIMFYDAVSRATLYL